MPTEEWIKENDRLMTIIRNLELGHISEEDVSKEDLRTLRSWDKKKGVWSSSIQYASEEGEE